MSESANNFNLENSSENSRNNSKSELQNDPKGKLEEDSQNPQEKKTFLIIDTFYFMHRAFHAYPKDLKNYRGEITNMSFGFSQSILDMLVNFQPDYIACVWESIEQPSFRKELYKEYQINRVKDPDEDMLFQLQIPRIEEFLRLLGIKVFQAEGFEGDDVLGTLAKNSPGDVSTIITSADQDLMQLIDANISFFRPSKPPYVKSELLTPPLFKAKYSFDPIRMIDYKSLRGDPSDNIPGVKGVGDKTAKKLLAEFNSLEGVYGNLDNVASKSIRNKLEQDKENAFLSKQLATIITNIPLDFNLEDCVVEAPDSSKISHFLEEVGFKSLNKKLKTLEILYRKKVEEDSQNNSHQLNLFE